MSGRKGVRFEDGKLIGCPAGSPREYDEAAFVNRRVEEDMAYMRARVKGLFGGQALPAMTESAESEHPNADAIAPIANYVTTYELTDVASGQRVAAFHRYAHASYWTRKVGGKLSFYKCPEKPASIPEFLRTALNP